MSVFDINDQSSRAIEQLKVTVIMCAYTHLRWSALCEAVHAVTLQAPHELIIVIDHNEDMLTRSRVAFPHVIVVPNAEQRGLSGARNTGVAHAKGDLVAFLDDDACPMPGWLSELAGAFEDESVIGAGGVALPRWDAAAPTWIPAEFLWVVGCSYRGLPECPVEIRNPIGANMAFRRWVFDEVGGFTDGIGRVGRTPLGCEETELSIRAVAGTGGRIVATPHAKVSHLVPSHRTRWSYFCRRCWAEGLSKAMVARSVGSELGLRSERSYVIHTLPSGFLKGILDLLRGDATGLSRSAAIVAGLLLTSAGYLRGRVAGSERVK